MSSEVACFVPQATRLLPFRRDASLRIQRTSRSCKLPRPHLRPSIRASTQVPARFNSHLFDNIVTPLDLDIASHYSSSAPSLDLRTDFHYVDHESQIFVIVDYPIPAPESPHPGQRMISFIRDSLASSSDTSDLSHILSSAIQELRPNSSFSAVLAHVSNNILRVVSVGPAGLVIIREDSMVYRSFPHSAGAIIEHLTSSRSHASIHSIHSDFIELSEGDLVVAGTDGLFANLTDLQILAFVRPVPDRLDKTLSIANNTCLGSWTSDDVEFISYYLSNLATNFATADMPPSFLRFPFPACPHLDDVTVLCASCS